MAMPAKDLKYWRGIVKAIRKACSDQLTWARCETEYPDPDLFVGNLRVIIGNVVPSELRENGGMTNICESQFLSYESKKEKIEDPYHALISELVEGQRILFRERWSKMRDRERPVDGEDWRNDRNHGTFHGIIKNCESYDYGDIYDRFGKKYKGDGKSPDERFSWDFRVNDARMMSILIEALGEAKKLGMPTEELLQGYDLLTDMHHRFPSVLASTS